MIPVGLSVFFQGAGREDRKKLKEQILKVNERIGKVVGRRTSETMKESKMCTQVFLGSRQVLGEN